MLCSGINTDTIYYSISRCPRTSEFFFSILEPQSLLIRMHSTKSSDTTTWQDLRCPNLQPPTPHNICIFDMTLKLVCSFFFSSHPMISWQLEPKKTHVIHPSETSIYTLDIVTLLHLPGRSCSGRRNRRHLTSHGTVAAAPRTAETTSASFYFAGPAAAAGSSSDEIFLRRSQQSGMEVWMKKGILEKTPSLHIVNIEKLYLVGVRTARAYIMIAWYRSGQLLCNGGEFSDEHLVEGLCDGEVVLRLVPNLGLLHAADSQLQDRHPNNLDSILIKLVQAGEHQTQVGAGDHTVVLLDDHLHNTQTFRIQNKIQSQSWFQLKNLSSSHTCIVSLQHQNLWSALIV